MKKITKIQRVALGLAIVANTSVQLTVASVLTTPDFTESDKCVDFGRGSAAVKLLEQVFASSEECKTICARIGGCEAFEFKNKDNKCTLASDSPLGEFGKNCGKDSNGYIRAPCTWESEASPVGSNKVPRYCSQNEETLKELVQYATQETSFTEQLNAGNSGSCRPSAGAVIKDSFLVPNIESCMSICLEIPLGGCKGIEYRVEQGAVPVCHIHTSDVAGTPVVPESSSIDVKCYALAFVTDYATCKDIALADAECGHAYNNGVVLNYGSGMVEPKCVCVRADSICNLQTPTEVVGGSGYWTLRNCLPFGPTSSPTIAPSNANDTATDDPSVIDQPGMSVADMLVISLGVGSTALFSGTAYMFWKSKRHATTKRLSDNKFVSGPSKGRKNHNSGGPSALRSLLNAKSTTTLDSAELGQVVGNNPTPARKEKKKLALFQPKQRVNNNPQDRLSVQQKSALVSYLEDVEPGLKTKEIIDRADEIESRYSKANIVIALQKIYNRVPSGLVKELAEQVAEDNFGKTKESRISQLI